MLSNFCFHIYAQKCLSSQVVRFDPWDMLHNFCFHVYAQNSLFIGENANGYFGGRLEEMGTLVGWIKRESIGGRQMEMSSGVWKHGVYKHGGSHDVNYKRKRQRQHKEKNGRGPEDYRT